MDYILKDPTILQDPPHFQGRPSILVIIIKILIFNIKFLFQNIYLKKIAKYFSRITKKETLYQFYSIYCFGIISTQ